MSEEIENNQGGGCLKGLFWLTLIAIIAFAGCFFYLGDKGLGMAKQAVTRVVRTFKPVNVVETFHEFRNARIQGTEGNILEVATGEETIELSRESTLKMFGKAVPFGTMKSQIRVPATFRYHIDLTGKWDMIEDGKRLHVVAPSLIPSLPIAFDSEKMEKINAEGLSRYLAGSNMAELEKTVTPELKIRAEDPENIRKYHHAAKQSIAKFLQTWLIGEGLWNTVDFDEILIYFDGDLIDTENEDLIPDAKLEVEQPVLP